MAAYYNEIDPYAAQWLRNLITAGHIAPGDVDERSIEDVEADELREYTQCHFFAGIGGWSYALRLANWSDDRPVWTGSCPCQPFSAAGAGLGFADGRHLWPAFRSLIQECRPAVVFGEQVASKAAYLWIDLVHTDLERMDYAFGCIPFPAASVGAPNIRERAFWVANTQSPRRCGRVEVENGRSAKSGRSGARILPFPWPDHSGSGSALTVGDVCEASYGVPGRVGRLRGYGNAINPEAACVFIESVDDILDGYDLC